MDIVAKADDVARSRLATSLPGRWMHVQGVGRRASSLQALFSADEGALLTAAALVHDIGYAPDLAFFQFHPLDGARHLRAEGFPNRLCGLVAHHSCAYIEAEIRSLSTELSEWADECTALRDALWWADMTTTPEGDSTTFHDRIEEIQHRYGPDHLVSVFIRQARPELAAAVERTEERLRAAGLGHLAK